MPDKIGQGLVSSDVQIGILWAELALTNLTQSLQVPSVSSVYIPWVLFFSFVFLEMMVWPHLMMVHVALAPGACSYKQHSINDCTFLQVVTDSIHTSSGQDPCFLPVCMPNSVLYSGAISSWIIHAYTAYSQNDQLGKWSI